MLLEDITEIAIGVVLKRKEAKYKTKNSYEYKVFNLKSYEENIEYDIFYSEENLDNFVARKGDIIFRMSFPLKVIEVDEKIEGKLINNQYCIIRMVGLHNKIYNIEFIRWFLESKNAKRQFEKTLIGSSVKSVPVTKLRQLKIPFLHFEKQKEISKLINAWDKEKKLYEKLIIEKDKYYSSIIDKLINGGKK